MVALVCCASCRTYQVPSCIICSMSSSFTWYLRYILFLDFAFTVMSILASILMGSAVGGWKVVSCVMKFTLANPLGRCSMTYWFPKSMTPRVWARMSIPMMTGSAMASRTMNVRLILFPPIFSVASATPADLMTCLSPSPTSLCLPFMLIPSFLAHSADMKEAVAPESHSVSMGIA